MIESRFIEKLLNGREVEWFALEDIFDLKNGYTPSKSNKDYWENGTIPWFRMEDIRENGQILSSALQKVSVHAIKGGKLFPANSIIIATSATIGEHALITVPYLANQRFTNISLKKNFTNRVDSKFIFYYCFLLSDWCKKNTTISNFAAVDMVGFRKFPFPIPPIDVQLEIVRILDAFTSLTAELTAELTSRQKQYQYFKEHLLNINNNIVWKSLSEITITTKNIKWENNKKNYRYIDLTSVNRENNRITETIEINAKNAPSRAQKIIEKNDILFATTRPTQQRMTIVPEEYDSQIASTGYCVLRPNKEEVLPEWIYYNISTIDFKNYVEEYQSGSAYPAISDYKVKEYKIPIPSIQMQEKLISILNRFEELTHSIEAGLPSEIQLRKQQYEYYRNMLLNFK
ncbi:restriction endonuclease subunit S [Glaesserella parasuis]|uniref:restriction endonuclease subunit S n=2 Tax=Glaesserella parasuis TaxID=738 RepID=UPI001352F5D7|nr:restriction endonuclease subunit S [Glaesserella parasuis]MCT8764474.1 restriction endonuclease subunit S [Glaesserella parasuis]MCT8768999.1 restriction endonuclease subunit S [Glaesserella parasuis]MWQ40523.1 restriction endonuclease subunit S [Glaesserella parasuis]